MESFDTKIKLDYDSLKLNKLLKDAQRGNIINSPNTKQETSLNQTVNSVQNQDKFYSNDIETLDLSNEVEKKESFQSTNLESKKSVFTNSESLNLNQDLQLEKEPSKDNIFENKKVENNTNLNNVFSNKNTNSKSSISQEKMSDFKTSIDAKQTIKNSDHLQENSNLSNNQNFSHQSNMNNQNINMTTNNLANTNEKTTSSIEQQTGININSSDIELNDNNNVVTTEKIKNNTDLEVEIYEYQAKLREYGITEQDITRLENGELTSDELIKEIENDKDTSRKRALLEASYLRAYNLEVADMNELKQVISATDKKIEKLSKKRSQLGNRDFITENIDQEILKNQQIKDSYQYIYDNINREIGHYLENIDPYISKTDFLENSNLNDDCLKTVQKIMKDYSFAKTGTYDKAVPDVLIEDQKQLTDIIACIINNTGNISQGYFRNDNGVIFHLKSKDEYIEHYTKWAPLMTDEEVATFNYIYNKKGVEAANQYLNDLSDKLDNRYLMKKVEEDSEYAKIHPISASVASVAITPLEGLSAVHYSINLGKNIKRVDVYSTGNIWRGQVAQDIAKNHGEGLAFLYDTGMSMVDSASLIGLSVVTGGTATPVLSATIMGSRAYVSTINDALDRGLSEGSAIALAFSSAVVETAMESVSVSHLLNLEEKMGKNTIKLTEKIAKNIKNPTLAKLTSKSFYISASALSQGLVEGEEEFATEILNYVADIFIAKDLSNYTTSINNYLEQGYTENESLIRTMKDFSKQATSAFLGGFISGSCFGTLSSSVTTYQSKRMANNILDQYRENSTQSTVFSKSNKVESVTQSQVNNSNVKMTDEQINQILESIYSSYKHQGLDYLRSYVEYQDVKYIINVGNYRTIIKEIPIEKIQQYIDRKKQQMNNNIKNNIKMTDKEIDKKLNEIYNTMEYYYKNQALVYLQEYVKTGNINYIFNAGDHQNIIKIIPIEKIQQYIDRKKQQMNNNIKNNIKMTDQEIDKKLDEIYNMLEYYYPNQAPVYLREYVKTGNINYILNASDHRTIIKMIPMEKIQQYIDSKEQNSIKNNIKMTDQEIDKKLDEIYNTLEASFSNQALVFLREYVKTGDTDYIPNVGDYRTIIKEIPIEKIQQYINRKEQNSIENKKIINKRNANIEMSNFFENISKSTGQYGVDQADIEKLCFYHVPMDTNISMTVGYHAAKQIVNEAKEKNQPIPHIKKVGYDEYYRLKQKIVDKGFSKSDASIILSSINDAGACSYASLCNNIMYQFKDDLELYEKTFGYPMFREENGKYSLNSAELLLDMYLFVNSEENGGRFIKNNKINENYISTTIDVFGRNILNASKQVYMSTSLGRNEKVIRKFLKSKNNNIDYHTELVIENYSGKNIRQKKMNNIIKSLNESLENGYDFSLGIYQQKNHIIHLISYDKNKYSDMSTDIWNEGVGHSVAITKIENDGFVVSSWGQKYLIPYDDLFKGGWFVISKNKLEIRR